MLASQALVLSALNYIDLAKAEEDKASQESLWTSRVEAQRRLAEEANAERDEARARLASVESEMSRLKSLLVSAEASHRSLQQEADKARAAADEARGQMWKYLGQAKDAQAAFDKAEAAARKAWADTERARAETAEALGEVERVRAELTARLDDVPRQLGEIREQSYTEGFTKGQSIRSQSMNEARAQAVEDFKASAEYAETRDADFASAGEQLVDLIRRERPEWDLNFLYQAGTPQVPSIDLTGEDGGEAAIEAEAPTGGEGQADAEIGPGGEAGEETLVEAEAPTGGEGSAGAEADLGGGVGDEGVGAEGGGDPDH